MSVFENDGLNRLNGLHRDLTALENGTLQNIERLMIELDQRHNEFVALLEKKGKNEESLKTLNSGIIHFEDDPIQVNDEFKAQALDVAELLDLDQLDAAKILYLAVREDNYDRSPLYSAVLMFHTYRVFLLDCFRLITHYTSVNEDEDLGNREVIQFCHTVFTSKKQGPQGQQGFFLRCLGSMEGIEQWLAKISTRLNALVVINQSDTIELEILELEQDRLVRQHEALAEIMTDMERIWPTTHENLKRILAKARQLEKYDVITMHYMAPLISMLFQFGRSEQRLAPEEASKFNDDLVTTAEGQSWKLRHFHAAMKCIWIASYASRSLEPAPASTIGANAIKQAEKASSHLIEALHDGAFQFLLLVCREMKSDDWYDPARHELTDFLLKESNSIHFESCLIGMRFRRKYLEGLQMFVENFVTNMPDTIRRLKLEEDDQRRFLHSQLQGQREESFNLEQLLVIISYAYEDFAVAAVSFWTDADSNLHGFLSWSSQRLSTPRAAAFCEMLITLSGPGAGAECADAAHNFLLPDIPQPMARPRRNSPLSWDHIYAEIGFYAERVRDHLQARANPAVNSLGKADATNYEEPESNMMLESYLRLMAHLSTHSSKARQWLLSVPEFRVTQDLLYLCSPLSTPRLRACGFNALRALLTDKDRALNDLQWDLLDEFVWRKSITVRPSGSFPLETEQAFFASLHDSGKPGLELPSAFVHLLSALCAPATDIPLNDALPFPETLGINYRIAGMDGYVDFVLDRVFNWSSTLELVDPTLLRILRLRCVDFISQCLSSFNENLIVFASTTKVSIDASIHTSTVQAYLQLHPFARTMEWFYNEKSIKALFETATQNVEEVDASEEGSPLLQSTVRAVEVMHLILALQPTYLHIVKPQLRERSNGHRPSVANLAFASFEDAILNHLPFVATLGQYCACSHHELSRISLKLLHQLASSRKLSVPGYIGRSRRLEKSRLLTALERDDQAQTIAKSLAALMRYDEREFEQGHAVPGFNIKLNLLRFLNQSLLAAPDRPTIAHLLLGFTCSADAVGPPAKEDLESETTLFGSILRFVAECPDGDGPLLYSWLIEIKHEAMALLQKLWRSPLSAAVTMLALRSSQFLFLGMVREPILRAQTLWVDAGGNVRRMDDPEFFICDTADALARFLAKRSALLELIATDCRECAEMGAATILTQIKSTITGWTTFNDGTRVQHASLQDFLDAFELEDAQQVEPPQSPFFNLEEVESCKMIIDQGVFEYDIGLVDQLLQLQAAQVRKAPNFDPSVEGNLESDLFNISTTITRNNRVAVIRHTRQRYLKAWAQVTMLILQTCDFDPDQRAAFVLQYLHLVLPRFEASIKYDQDSAMILAQLVKSLLTNVSGDTMSGEGDAGSDAANERLFHTFRIALVGIQEVSATSEVREMCCQICHGFIARLLSPKGISARRRQAMQLIKSGGTRLLEILGDEAYNGSESSRLSALAALNSFIILSNFQASRHVADTLSRINFIQVLIDGLGNIPAEMQGVHSQSGADTLPHQDAAIALLLYLSQTRPGAMQVVNAGLFPAIQASEIFSADPDVGLDIDNPRALTVYFRLMLALLRVVNAVILSVGEENDQVIGMAQNFVASYRLCIVSVFKRSAGIGSTGQAHQRVLSELVNNFTILMSVCGFMEAQPEAAQQDRGQRLFT